MGVIGPLHLSLMSSPCTFVIPSWPVCDTLSWGDRQTRAYNSSHTPVLVDLTKTYQHHVGSVPERLHFWECIWKVMDAQGSWNKRLETIQVHS